MPPLDDILGTAVLAVLIITLIFLPDLIGELK
jgi:hypothetical protein